MHQTAHRSLLGALLLAAAFLPGSVRAQSKLLPERFAFSPEGRYEESIPSPASFLGYELGTRFTLYANVVAYLKALDAASDRVTMQEYGRTYEGRPLYTLIITTPANHARLEEIRLANLALADPASMTDAEARARIAKQPIITWLSYNVHGNEASSTEAAMQVAYRLAAGRDPDLERELSESVIIMDPDINPDGRDRFVYWYTSMQSAQLATDSRDLEHDEPWPGGRTNHYWFDLNRDWVWLVHPESRGRIAAYQRWLPQVHVDHHEQGFNDNYFTMPGITPRNRQLPDDYEKWATVFGRANTDAFDEHRIMYATRESFDFYYPGYGSSYPSVMGAIGMLVEQGGHSRAGRAVEAEDGYLLTLRQRIFDHYTTSLAAVKTAVQNRVALLHYFRAAFSESTNKGKAAAYVFPDDPLRSPYTYDVIDMLLRHGVRVERAAAAFTLADARNYWDDAPRRHAFEAGTFLIPGDQPRHVFIHTILQRNLILEDSVTYDMASWSAPLAYNMEAYWTATKPRVASSRVTEAPRPLSGVVGSPARYAYVVDWRQRHAPQALARLWEAGYRVRFARKAFSDGTYAFGHGALVVLLGRNPEGLDPAADMERIAREAGVEIVALNSGRMASGIDLGSDDSRPIPRPKVALLVDRPVSSYAAGFLWYLFDRETGLELTRLRAGGLASVDLTDFDVLIVPDAGNLETVFDSTKVGRVRQWIEAGGTLVASQRSALLFTRGQSGLTDVETVADPEPASAADSVASRSEADASALVRYADRQRLEGLRRVPGSALQAGLDGSHPLAAGLPERFFTLKFGSEALVPKAGLQSVGTYGRDVGQLLVAGYASEENKKKLAGRTFAAVQPMGEGRVIFLLDPTEYRGFWVGPSRLMQNAVMLAPAF